MINTDMVRTTERFKHSIFIFLASFMVQSCVFNKGNEIRLSNEKISQLNHKEYFLVEKWVKSSLPSCGFLYINSSGGKYTTIDVMKCIQDFDLNFQQSHKINMDLPDKLPRYLQKKIYPQRIDYYLGKKLPRFLSRLSTSELTVILKFLVDTPYGESEKLIKALIKSGAETKDILIQRNLSTNGSTCKSSLYILNKNKKFYQSAKFLQEPVLYRGVYLQDNQYRFAKPNTLYRKNVMFTAVNDVVYMHCKEPILAETLIRINPNLRDTVHARTGETPLHRYLIHFGTRNFPDPVGLGQKLISKNNINVKDKMGQTPLRKLLQLSLNTSEEYVRMVKVLIEAGAKLDLKDNDGISARELILRHPKLKELANLP